MRILAFMVCGALALLGGAAPALAEELPDFPGWRLERVEEMGNEAADFEYKDFFVLTPSGTRPPITVDGGTAARLLNGQANPETIYSERATAATRKKEDAAGGNGAVGWQIAESTYVPVGEEKNRSPATGLAGGSSAAVAGAAAATSGAYGVGGVSAGAAGGIGAGVFAGPAAGSGSSAAGTGFNGGAMGRAPAGNGGTGGSGADTGNMTYSQMIESANSAATQSLCARMGRYAPAGSCK